MDVRELNKKIHLAIQSPIIGAVDFDEEEWAYIQKQCDDTYEATMMRRNKTFVASYGMDCVVLMIIRCAKQWMSGRENKFWSSIFEKIFDDPNVSQQKMYDAIEQVLLKHGAQGVFTSPSGRLFYSFILYHAMAPRESIEAFITMLWRDFYLDEELLNANYERDNPLIAQLRKSLCRMFEKKEMLEKDIEFGKGKYSVRSGLKQAFMQRPEAEMMELLHIILSRMDQLYYGNTQTDESDALIRLCDEIINKLIYAERHQEERSVVRTRGHALPDISRVSAVYRMDPDKGPMIAFPKMRALDTEEDHAILKLYVGSRTILQKRLPVLGTELKRMLEPIEIPLESYRREFSGEFSVRVEILIDDKICFDSKTSLYRKALLFKNDIERQGTVLLPDTYDVYMPFRQRTSLRTKFSGQCGNEMVGCIPVSFVEGDFLEVDGLAVLFSTYTAETKLHLSGETVRGMIWNFDNKKYRVYHSMPIVRLGPIAERDVHASYGVYHNREYIGPLKETAELTDKNYWQIDMDSFTDEAYHHIEIRDMKTGDMLTEKTFCICEDAKVVPEYYYGSHVKYCYHDRGQVRCVWNGNGYSVSMGKTGDFPSIPAEPGFLTINPPCLKWRIDQLGWNRRNSQGIQWYCAQPMHNNVLLEIEADFEVNITLWLGDKAVSRIPGEKHMFRLGDAISQWKNYEDTVTLVVDEDRHELFTITKKPRLISRPEISMNDGILFLDAVGCLLGDSDARLCLTLSDEDEKEYHIDNLGIRDQIEIEIPDDFYMCRIDLLVNRLTGEKTYLGTIEDVSLGNPYLHLYDDIALVLSKTTFIRPDTKEKYSAKIMDCSIRDIEFLEMGLDEPLYRGKLYTPLQKAVDVELFISEKTLSLRAPEGAEYVSFAVRQYAGNTKNKKKEVYAILAEKSESENYSCSRFYYEFDE